MGRHVRWGGFGGIVDPPRPQREPAVYCVKRFSALARALQRFSSGGSKMSKFLQTLWSDQHGQDIAEYAVMLAAFW